MYFFFILCVGHYKIGLMAICVFGEWSVQNPFLLNVHTGAHVYRKCMCVEARNQFQASISQEPYTLFLRQVLQFS